MIVEEKRSKEWKKKKGRLKGKKEGSGSGWHCKVVLLMPISCTLCAFSGHAPTELAPDCFFSLRLHLFENTSSVQLHPEGILH